MRSGTGGTDGFTLIEVVLTVALAALVLAAVGSFSVSGPSVAVAAAADDVAAAFDEARRTASAFDAASVVVTATPGGISIRVYRRLPGDAIFAAAGGPTYDAGVTADETAAPLGAPGFAFGLDRRGTVVGFADFQLDAPAYSPTACPPAGAFAIALRRGPQARTVAIPCAGEAAAVAPAAFGTAPPAVTPAPQPAPSLTCPGTPCPLPTLLAATAPTPTPLALTVTPSPVAPTPQPTFAGSIVVGLWITECPGGTGDCDGGSLQAQEPMTAILGGPADYVACFASTATLGGMPRSFSNAGTMPTEQIGAVAIPPFDPIVRSQIRWDVVVPPGTVLAIATTGTDGCP